MRADLLVQRYSRALFQTTETNKTTEKIATELSVISKIFSQNDVIGFFCSPFVATDTKTMVAKSTLEGKCSPELFNFMSTVVQNERMNFLNQISEAYLGLVRAKGGETEGILYVAGEASEGFQAQVEAKLSQSLNKKVKLKVQKDPALLAGFKVTVGGWTMDDSIQFHLNKIKEETSKKGT